MKKFFLKLFIYSLLISLIILGLNALYIQKENDGTRKFTDGVPNNIQVCNFGSSHGLSGFNYEDAERKYTCFNFALGSQTLLYDYKVFINYKDKIQKGAKVFLLASYFSFFGVPDVQDRQFASKNKRYYKFLSPDLIEQYDTKTNFYVNYFPSLAADDLVSFFRVIMPKAPTNNAVHSINPAQAKGIARHTCIRHITQHTDINGQRIYNHEAIKALYDLINLCREIEAEPILITMPYLHEYVNEVEQGDPEFFNDFYSIINEVTQKTGIKYYDYARDERYTSNYALFSDTDHLNKNGARKFTNDILREVAGL